MSVMERILKLQTAGGGKVNVSVRIFPPEKRKTSWQCQWEIHWPDRVRQNTAGGQDAIQALLHALQMIGVELYTSQEHREGRLHLDGVHGGYGFPLTANCRDLLEGDDAKFL